MRTTFCATKGRRTRSGSCRRGVPTGAARYAGTIHDFLMLDAVADTIPAKAALAQACGVLREALAE